MDSDEVHRRWEQRTGEYSPDYYADYGPNRTSELIRAVLEQFVRPDEAVLELGCSAGRHLAHLHEHGYENLYGIDINDEARDAMEHAYPGLADDGTFYFDAIENVVPDFEDGRFAAVFSVETLQHVPPENEWVFDELARVTDRTLVTAENEHDSESAEATVDYVDEFPMYHRRWDEVFTDRGFVEVDSVPDEMDTFRVFRAT